MPPRAANTSSFCAIALARRIANAASVAERERKDVSRRNLRDRAIAQFEHQATGPIDADKTPMLPPPFIADSYLFADAARVREPVGDDRIEPAATLPLSEPPAHC